MESTEKLWILYAVLLSLNCLTAEEITTDKKKCCWNNSIYIFKKCFDTKIYIQGQVTGKRISIFVSTENEKLWIPSRLIWFDEARPPESAPLVIQHSKQLVQSSLADYSQDFCVFLGYPWQHPLPAEICLERMMPKFPNIVYKCLFS